MISSVSNSLNVYLVTGGKYGIANFVLYRLILSNKSLIFNEKYIIY